MNLLLLVHVAHVTGQTFLHDLPATDGAGSPVQGSGPMGVRKVCVFKCRCVVLGPQGHRRLGDSGSLPLCTVPEKRWNETRKLEEK